MIEVHSLQDLFIIDCVDELPGGSVEEGRRDRQGLEDLDRLGLLFSLGLNHLLLDFGTGLNSVHHSCLSLREPVTRLFVDLRGTDNRIQIEQVRQAHSRQFQ